MRSLIAAFRFLTRLPVPGPDTRSEDLPASVGWFPLVGALVGLAIGGAYVGLLLVFPWMVAGVLAIAFGLLLTGGFHEDGASDAADGLGGGWTRERVLEIMKDSRVGAYGSMALWVVLCLRLACLSALDASAWWALALAMAWGRWSAALLVKLPPIGSGLAKEVSWAVPWWTLPLATVLAAVATALVWWRFQVLAPWAAVAAIVMTLLWMFYLARRLGGQSGDLLGAGNQLAEAAALLVLVAVAR